MTETQKKKLAKRLAVLVAEKGENGISEIKPALEKILANASDSEQKRFLKLFSTHVRRELAKDTLTIESAETLDSGTVDSIVKSFTPRHPRSLHVVQLSSPELISGIRVRLGDTIYDASVSGKLQTLAASIN